MDEARKLSVKAASMGLNHCRRHILMCAEPDNALCCSYEQTQVSWQYLKRRLKELKLCLPQGSVHRSRVNCLAVCERGPVAVVYPDGVWYHSCTPEVLEEIIQKHLIRGLIVEEYAFSVNVPLNPCGACGTCEPRELEESEERLPVLR